jgi:hypothetical protein
MANPCETARTEIRRIALEIRDGVADPLRAANAIYWAAWNAGAWKDDSACGELADPGAEFLQLADALERYQDDSEVRRVWQDLIREAAEAYLTGAAWRIGMTRVQGCPNVLTRNHRPKQRSCPAGSTWSMATPWAGAGTVAD